jgi:hypothetical protein
MLYIVCVNLLQHLVSVQGYIKSTGTVTFGIKIKFTITIFSFTFVIYFTFRMRFKEWKVKMTIPCVNLAILMVW